MPNSSRRSHHLFVVRTWQEANHVAPDDQWRGSVEHIPTGQRLYFSSLEQLCQFVSSQCDWFDTGNSSPLMDERPHDASISDEDHNGPH